MKVYLLYAHYEFREGYDYVVEVFSNKKKALERMQAVADNYMNEFEVTKDSEDCEVEEQEDAISIYPQGYYGDYSAELWIKEHEVL
jgi:hypothetical protein